MARLQQVLICALLLTLIIVLLHWAFPSKVHAQQEHQLAPTAVGCDVQHVAACRQAIRFWHRKASQKAAAVRWQRHARETLDRMVHVLSVRLRTPVDHVLQWTCIHGHEGAWNDKGDPYWGGLQMDRNFMRTYGGDMIWRYSRDGSLGFANEWTPLEQIVVAERAYDSGRGFHPWPNTAHMCGYI